MIARLAAAGVLMTLAAVLPAAAQGNSGNQRVKTPNGNRLLTRGVGESTTPVALIDDATLLDRGSAAFSLSVMRWSGSGISEVDAPVVYGAVGVHPRLQFSFSIPRVVGSSDSNGVTGGVGTVFFGGKVSVFNDTKAGLKMAVSPTVEILSQDALASMAAGSSRAQFGLPVGLELQRGARKVYAGVGYYSNGSWFAGLGGGFQATPKVSVILAFSHAWTNASTTDVTLVAAARSEVSLGVSRALTSLVSVYGSIGQTVATLDENGAGTTLAAGVSLFVPAGTFTH